MLMRLAYSIAIQIPFDVLLLDEVLAVGDEAFQEKCAVTFEQFKSEGKTIVLVTHALELLERFADRVLVLDHGVVREIGAPEEVTERYREAALAT
jgi:ABC-type polysaccharide/polyol phosphate transport system ATPase subunit